MSIVSSETIADPNSSNGLRSAIHYFTDHLGNVIQHGPFKSPDTDTETEYAAMRAAIQPSIEDSLKENEINRAILGVYDGVNPSVTPEHNTQVEYDRKVLGRMMQVKDVQAFYTALSFFQAVEIRGGANATQRAAYLGVTKANYDLIAARFGDVQGIAFFLNDDKNQIWTKLPEEFY